MKPKAYAYIRMSTGQQRRGDSYRRQLEAVELYAAEHGLDYRDEYRLEDIGVSAFNGSNIETGAFGGFVRKAKAGQIDGGSYLLVESLDRLSRDAVENALTVFLNILQNGIIVVTLLDKKRFKTGEFNVNELVASITVMARANEESVTKSRRLSASWEKKRSIASTFKLTGKCPSWLRLDQDRRCFSVLEPQAIVVRDIFELAAGGYGNFFIAKHLNERLIEPIGAKAKGWQKSSIQRILSSKAAIGSFQPHKLVDGKLVPTGPELESYYPAVIDRDLFYRAVNARKERRVGGGGRKGKRISNLFSGIAKCGYCNGPIHMFNRGDRGGRWLQCDNARRAVPIQYGSGRFRYRCLAKGWAYEDFEISFLTFCTAVNLPSFFDAGEHQSAIDDAQRLVSNTKGVVASIQSDQLKTYKLLLSSDEQDAFLQGQLQRISEELKVAKHAAIDAERQLADAVSKAEVNAVSTVELPKFIKQLQVDQGQETTGIRAAVSSHLRSITQELKLFSVGKPKDASDLSSETLKPEQLRALGHTEDEIENWPECLLRIHPTHLPHFEAEFSGSGHYEVVPDPNSASDYLYLAVGGKTLIRDPCKVPIRKQPDEVLILL